MEYYTYAYLREDRTPYYIGKGKGTRVYQKQSHRSHGIYVPPKNRIIILKKNLTENEAFKHEIYLISVFGRKDNNTGILYNRTNGGDNPPRAKKNQINRINALRKMWKEMKDEDRKIRSERISKAKKGKGNNLPTCKVLIIELEKEFNSIKEAAAFINGDTSAITKCLNKRGQRRHRGFTFKRL